MKHDKNMKNFFFFLLFQTMKQALEKKNDLTQNLKKKNSKKYWMKMIDWDCTLTQ